MSDRLMNAQDIASRESEIEVLARENAMPVETVHEIYNAERAKLEQAARIKTYVPVLIHRRVKDLLRSHRAVS
jgi:hypothetical protein